MLELEQIKELVDIDYTFSQDTRDAMSSDLVFYWITQWDDAYIENTDLEYRGQFDQLRKAGRHILSSLAANPVQVDFEPEDLERDDLAELADGLYRTDIRNNTAIEAHENAKTEAVVCGYGAWERFTEYSTSRMGERNQVTRSRPIYEACNTTFWDSSAKLLDKSDANRIAILERYDEDSYKKLYEDLTGEKDHEVVGSAFIAPNHSYTFPWFTQNSSIYVVRFYHRETIRVKCYEFTDIFGNTLKLKEEEAEARTEELLDTGYTLGEVREYDQEQVTHYIISGEKILEARVIAGTEIPVVPVYCERAFVEGEEHVEGIVRLAKDPQRLRNFQLSYLASLAGLSGVEKPHYFPEQIQGFEEMYEQAGKDDKFPYKLLNRITESGEALPQGPLAPAKTAEPPTALLQSLEYSSQAISDVADAGVPQDVADTELSGKAVRALMQRIDQQNYTMQQHYKHALRRDGEIFISQASVILDTPRSVTITKPDESKKTVKLHDEVYDSDYNMNVENDITDMGFHVYADIGVAYSSQREESREEIRLLLSEMLPDSPFYLPLKAKYIKLLDGYDFEDIRNYADKILVQSGIKEPETDEERQMMADQQDQEDPATIAARGQEMVGEAELKKAQAQIMDKINDEAKNEIDRERLRKEWAELQMKAEEAGIKLEMDSFEKVEKLSQKDRELDIKESALYADTAIKGRQVASS